MAVGPLKDEQRRWTQSAAAAGIVLAPAPPTPAMATTRVSDARHLDGNVATHVGHY